jgi:hypothetical protein
VQVHDGTVHLDLTADAPEQVEQLLQAVASNRLVGQATGVLVAVHRIDADQAWELLRRGSRNSNIKVTRLAAAVVALASGTADVEESDPAAAQVAQVILRPGRASSSTALSRHDRRALGAIRDLLADERDVQADLRDRAAASRDEHGERHPVDADAAADRAHAARDRAAAATDRRIASDDRMADT